MLIIAILIFYAVWLYFINENLKKIHASTDENNKNFAYMYEETFGFPPSSNDNEVLDAE